MKQRICKKCGKTFDLTRKDKVFCTRSCKQYYCKRNIEYKQKHNNTCVKCGFKGHRCQIDIDHIDGNHNNKNESNLQILCANCHRLKTFENKDWHPNT